MSDKYKFQLIRNYLKFHVKDGRELKDLLDYLDQLQQKENIIKEVREYIMTELIAEWDIKNDGYVSGSDLPVDAITPILGILDKDKNEINKT